ncbi:protein binding / ubiquitin-protein ligase/ zinc ion binding [Ectocarpus siliculosus]|uniref:Protein binding / ubiquitin-protein ligase/ zinc ion binding n=1 Tax=Ectocarpus siliculosus TaxID=2880 RepID=D8LG18_ECTSI|nr:protein binding / ubiquitin-protein ligase/ zinc ion binding [Ectocarpus siliculosus]|eukprot:CBN78917.1 protein binding / ubiquitin-protein ligase/ zinc ion binding [Ectocarpus siliculosus]
MSEGADGGNASLSNAEEGRAATISPPDTASRRSAGPLRASLITLRSRRFVGLLLMICVFSLVQVGVLNWALVAWGFFGSLLVVSFFRLVRLVNGYAIRSNTARRRRQRIPRGALEARLQLHHPGIELGRLRLLLVDRDFTGEDYQALLDLDDNNDVPSTVGASEGEIRRNPSFVIPEPAADSVVKPKNCSICLYPFKPRERVRIIPCLHQFHTECIDPWLRQNAICPVCKFPAVG